MTRHRRKADSVAATAEWTDRLRARCDEATLNAFIDEWSHDAALMSELVVQAEGVDRNSWFDEVYQTALIQLWDLAREIADGTTVSNIGGVALRRTRLAFRTLYRSSRGGESISGTTTWRRNAESRDAFVAELAEQGIHGVDAVVDESQRRYRDRLAVVQQFRQDGDPNPDKDTVAEECQRQFGHPGLFRPYQAMELTYRPPQRLDRPLLDDPDSATTMGDTIATYVDHDVLAMRIFVMAHFTHSREGTETAAMFFADAGQTTAADVADWTKISTRDARKLLTQVRDLCRTWWASTTTERTSASL